MVAKHLHACGLQGAGGDRHFAMLVGFSLLEKNYSIRKLAFLPESGSETHQDRVGSKRSACRSAKAMSVQL
jgi:hypothetical protein